MQNLFDFTKKDFFNYLTSLGISLKSHKNYRSDISHFHAWLKIKVKAFGSLCETLDDAVPFLNSSIATEYRSELLNARVPVKTINRRLSTLRHLSRFLTSTLIADFDFMGGVENVNDNKKSPINTSSVIGEFRAYLEAEKASQNTIKNYLSDIHQFLVWLELNNPV